LFQTNTFQCVLVTDGRLSFVIFLYAEGLIQWTTGDASGGTNGFGGTPAQVGFNAGDGIQYASVQGSQTADIVNIDERLGNTGLKGVWIFRVDDENIRVTNCTSIGMDSNIVDSFTVGTWCYIVGNIAAGPLKRQVTFDINHQDKLKEKGCYALLILNSRFESSL